MDEDAVLTVKRVSTFQFREVIRRIAAVDCDRAWLVLNPVDADRGRRVGLFTRLNFVDKDGSVLRSVCLSGEVGPITSDGDGNCYVEQENTIRRVTAIGNINNIIKACKVTAMTCRDVPNGAGYELLVSQLDDDRNPSVSTLHVYSTKGKHLSVFPHQDESVEIHGHKYEIRHRNIFLHRALVMFERLLHPVTGHGKAIEDIVMYDPQGSLIRQCSASNKLDVPITLLRESIYDDSGVAIIDVQGNKLFQSRMTGCTMQTAQVLLDLIIESCITISDMPCCRCFGNSIWTIEDGQGGSSTTVSVFKIV